MGSSIALVDAHTCFLYINNKSGENEINQKNSHIIIGYRRESTNTLANLTSASSISGLNEPCYRSCPAGLGSIVSCMRTKVLLFQLDQWAPSCYIRHDAKSSHHPGIHTFLLMSRDAIILQPTAEGDKLIHVGRNNRQQLDALLKHLDIILL